MITPESAPTMSAVRNTISTPTASYFGGARNSSAERLSMFSMEEDMGEKEKKCSDRYKYICEVQDCKIFYYDKIHHSSDKDTLVSMWECSCKYHSVGDIEKSAFFLVLYAYVVIYKSYDDRDCSDLEKESTEGEWKSHSSIVRELETEIFSDYREVARMGQEKYRLKIPLRYLIQSDSYEDEEKKNIDSHTNEQEDTWQDRL